MLATLLVAFAFQQITVGVDADGKTAAKVKVIVREDGGTRDTVRVRQQAKLISASEAQMASAFADPGAQALLARARVARLAQDSSIAAYEAFTLQRLTLGMGFTKLGRERIFFRTDGAARVRWARGVGAQIDVTGKRSVVPIFGGSSEVDIESILSPIPYYPGRDAFWVGLAQARPTANEDDIIHPLARAAEAYYTYKSGDSVSFHLPNGQTIQLRELEVRPRKADWHSVVGSLWFDSTGKLVRAAYRLSQAFNFIEDTDAKNEGLISKAILRPVTATVNGVAVEYGLYQGRFWLPRSQVAEAQVQVGFMRMPMRIEESFTYASVNALDTLPVMTPRRSFPTAPKALARNNERLAAFRDSVYAARTKVECAETGQHSMRADRYGGSVPVVVHISCDSAALANSPALPKSSYTAGEEVFGDAERDILLAKAESMMPALPFAPGRPKIGIGLDLLRYNRVEGLSGAVDVTQTIGPGTAVRFTPRIGTADRVFNAELSLSRFNGQGTRAVTGYRRLDVANDWGNPLSFGSGLSAFLFGRDEGFYYRAAGAELTGDNLSGRELDWRVFTEHQSDAVARTNGSLPRTLGSPGFGPRENIAAARIRESGVSLRKIATFGLDPNGFRLLSDIRTEAATGDRDYARGALDLTLAHPIGRVLARDFSASVTAGAGTSAGNLPPQRFWYLGGTNSVRGQPAGTMSGTSYWLTRTEVGYGLPGFRRLVFADIGWAGNRRDFGRDRPASGVGVAASLMDGMVRFDVGRGIFPTKQWHTALYLGSRF